MFVGVHSSSVLPFVARAVVLVAIVLAIPVQSLARTQVGVSLLLLAGTHYETQSSANEHVGAPLFDFLTGGKRLEFAAEGIPTFGITSSGSSATFRTGTTSLGFGDAVFQYALDAKSRCWLGAGSIVIDQQTNFAHATYPSDYLTESSRVSGVRYEARLNLPVAQNAVIVSVAGSPSLWGTYFASNCRYCHLAQFSTPEHGAMTDTSAMFEIPRGRSIWDFGVRFINYSATFTHYNVLADRNVGGGIEIEYRYLIAR